LTVKRTIYHNRRGPIVPELSIRQAVSEEDVLKALVVRGIVFIEEQEVDWEGEIDEFEKTSFHVLGEAGGQPVAAGRLRELEDGWWKVERIAVRPRWRGHGYARALVKFIMDHVAAQGATKYKLHAQVYLEDFYESFGFVREGDVFDECGIDHILMTRRDD
jgi:predicted GNAT family N-acyltransferase